VCGALRNPLQQRTSKSMDDILYAIILANFDVRKKNLNIQGQRYKQDKIKMLITVTYFIKTDRKKNLNQDIT
jgi:hypothetical protein